MWLIDFFPRAMLSRKAALLAEILAILSVLKQRGEMWVILCLPSPCRGLRGHGTPCPVGETQVKGSAD